MNEFILNTSAAVLMLAATSAHSAPINDSSVEFEPVSAFQTMPLIQMGQEKAFAADFEERDLSRISLREDAFADSNGSIDGLWKSDS